MVQKSNPIGMIRWRRFNVAELADVQILFLKAQNVVTIFCYRPFFTQLFKYMPPFNVIYIFKCAVKMNIVKTR